MIIKIKGTERRPHRLKLTDGVAMIMINSQTGADYYLCIDMVW